MSKRGEDDLWGAERIGDDVHVTLAYPRSDGEANAIQVHLSEVRAADRIRISYDFERDGWKIEQPSNHGPWAGNEEPDEGWREVAFVKSWALAPLDREPKGGK